MGTKKRRSSEEPDDDNPGNAGFDVDKEKATKRKRRNRWLAKMKIGGKRKSYRSLSEEHLHDMDVERPIDNVDVLPSSSSLSSVKERPDSEHNFGQITDKEGFLCEINIEGDEDDEIEIETVNEDYFHKHEHDKDDDVGNNKSERRKKGKNSDHKKKMSFGAALRIIRDSLGYKKWRKHSTTDYAKFSEGGSTEYISTTTSPHLPPTPPPSPSPSPIGKRHGNGDSATDPTISTRKGGRTEGKQRDKNSSTKNVRFATINEHDNDEDNETQNIEMTIDENHCAVDDPTSIPKKKKKLTRKKVAKAGRNTGRVLGEGIVLFGKNLQYLTPIPTQHVFGKYRDASSTSSSKSSTSRGSSERKPKKPNSYKHTAKAAPTNAYSFI